MTTFETHIRAIAEEHPAMALAMAVRVAEARAAGQPDPVDITDPASLAAYARTLPEVMAEIVADRPVHAMKHLRAATNALLAHAREAVSLIQRQEGLA